MTRFVLETKIDKHDPALYRPDKVAESIDGFEGLTSDRLARYRELGYLLVRNAFTDGEMQAALDELGEMTLSDDPHCEGVYYEGNIRDALAGRLPEGKQHGVSGQKEDLALGQTGETMPRLPAEERAKYVRKFHDFTEHHPPLKAIIEKPALVSLVERLLGEPSAVLQEMAMIKPPNGREKPWHQDHAYFNYPLDKRIIGAWIALGDATPENGCMHVIEGGHLDAPHVHWRRRDWQICDDEMLARPHTVVPMRCGDVLLFDSKLPHGTPTNRSDCYRWALQYHYIAASAVKTSDEERLAVFGNEGKDAVC